MQGGGGMLALFSLLMFPMFLGFGLFFYIIPLCWSISYAIWGSWWAMFGLSFLMMGYYRILTVMFDFTGYGLIDFSETYGNAALGDVRFARTDAKCLANVYNDMENMGVDNLVASDSDYYLNTI